jgi:hypothetical protein
LAAAPGRGGAGRFRQIVHRAFLACRYAAGFPRHLAGIVLKFKSVGPFEKKLIKSQVKSSLN